MLVPVLVLVLPLPRMPLRRSLVQVLLRRLLPALALTPASALPPSGLALVWPWGRCSSAVPAPLPAWQRQVLPAAWLRAVLLRPAQAWPAQARPVLLAQWRPLARALQF